MSRLVARDPDLSPFPPRAIARATMAHRWEQLAFVHWPSRAEAIERLLPPGLQVDTFDGTAWVGIVPFRLAVRLPAWSPVVPWLSTTLEANLRTYVRGPDGRRGIFFLTLDASRLSAVVVARAWYGIAYRWARLRFERYGRLIRYQSSRREPVSARLDLRLALGPRVRADHLTDLERFLICRWRLYSRSRRGVTSTEVEHEPWPLRRAEVVALEETMSSALGIPRGAAVPVAHYSPGVDVRFGPRIVAGAASQAMGSAVPLRVPA